jgi:serine phosphatase RsbU (regulator of sigma subunit)
MAGRAAPGAEEAYAVRRCFSVGQATRIEESQRGVDESELAVALFRTAFLILILTSPQFIGARGRAGLLVQVPVMLAALYNCGLLVMHWKGRRVRGQRGFIVAADLGVVTLWVAWGGQFGVNMFALYYAVIVVAGLWFGMLGTLLSALLGSILYSLALWAGPGPEALNAAFRNQIPYLLLVSLLLGYLLEAHNRERTRLHSLELDQAQATQRMRTLDEFYGEFTPLIEPPEGLDVARRFRPAVRMGAGDYYDFLNLGDGSYGLVVADIAGKYAPGVFRVPLIKYALIAAASLQRRPSATLAAVNRMVYPHLQPELLVSMFYVVIDTKRGSLTYSCAGHDPPFLVRASSEKTVMLEMGGLPFGVEPEGDWPEETLSLEPGDMLLMYTDGAVSGVCNAAGEEFGLDRLRAAVLAAVEQGLSAEETAERLFAQLNDFCKGGCQRDDITLLVARLLPQ